MKMKFIKGKLLGLFLAVCMLFSIMPTKVFASDVTNYDLWVGGVQVTSANMGSITGAGITGAVNYDPTTKTLTLDATDISFEDITIDGNTITSGIYAKDDLFIKTIGTDGSRVTDIYEEYDNDVYGVYCDGDLTIDTTINSFKVNSVRSKKSSYGIKCTSTLTVITNDSNSIYANSGVGKVKSIGIEAVNIIVTADAEDRGLSASADVEHNGDFSGEAVGLSVSGDIVVNSNSMLYCGIGYEGNHDGSELPSSFIGYAIEGGVDTDITLANGSTLLGICAMNHPNSTAFNFPEGSMLTMNEWSNLSGYANHFAENFPKVKFVGEPDNNFGGVTINRIDRTGDTIFHKEITSEQLIADHGTGNSIEIENCKSETIIDPDIATVNTAKGKAENAVYANPTNANDYKDETSINSYIKGLAEIAVNDSSVTVMVNKVNYVAPVNGTVENKNGTNGSYECTITVSKGKQTQTTTTKTVVIPAKVFEFMVYKVLNGDNQSVVEGSDKTITFRVDGDIAKLKAVYHGDKLLVKDMDYIATAGSVIITLKPDFSKALKKGNHAFKVEFIDGSATVNMKITEKPSLPSTGDEQETPQVNVPKTGDNNMMIFYLIVALITLGGMAFTTYRKKA